MTYRKSLLKYCTASFKHHKHTCLQRPHCEYLWELQAKERQPQLGQLTQPWEWISIKCWAVLRWPSLEVRAFSERAAGLCFSPKERFSHRQSQTLHRCLSSQWQGRNARPQSDLASSLGSHKHNSEQTLHCHASCRPDPSPAWCSPQTEPPCTGSSAHSGGKCCQTVQPALRNSQINAILFNNPISFSWISGKSVA